MIDSTNELGETISNPVMELANILRDGDIKLHIGLKAQGHIPTIERMLAEEKDWVEISAAIGWEQNAAKKHYGWYVEDQAIEEARRRRSEDGPIIFGDLSCPKCSSFTTVEEGRGWWCLHKDCVLSKRPGDFSFTGELTDEDATMIVRNGGRHPDEHEMVPRVELQKLAAQYVDVQVKNADLLRISDRVDACLIELQDFWNALSKDGHYVAAAKVKTFIQILEGKK